ncbi:MAG: hypothetical protein E5W55_01600 [Mesorhizobium sp.]|nr:MAG: hypothetical protein E5W55_01600 [Mesorhizobium sp.]
MGGFLSWYRLVAFAGLAYVLAQWMIDHRPSHEIRPRGGNGYISDQEIEELDREYHDELRYR